MFDMLSGMEHTRGADFGGAVEARAALGELPVDLASLDSAEAGRVLGRLKVVRGFLDAYEARLTAHLGRLAADGLGAPAADVHTRCGGISAKDARRRERRAEALEAAPALAERLAGGEVSAAHADAFADATWRLDEATRQAFVDQQEGLAAEAATMTPEEFARTCRQAVRRVERDGGVERDRRQRRETRLTTRVDLDGMYVLDARLHPEMGQVVFNALEVRTASLVAAGGDRTVDRSRVRAEALAELVSGARGATRPAEAEIRLHVDAAALVDPDREPVTCEYEDGTPLPISTARRFACNGRIVPLVIDTRGVVLQAGREQRLANGHQRRALRAMHRRCAFEGCDVPFARCEIHHLHPFELGGHTDLENLVPLCSRHHHLIHEPGWDHHLAPDRTLTIRAPDGRRHHHCPTSGELFGADRPGAAPSPPHPGRTPSPVG
jgi:Domain of unknown function (DUF222)/HNH endonuclease